MHAIEMRLRFTAANTLYTQTNRKLAIKSQMLHKTGWRATYTTKSTGLVAKKATKKVTYIYLVVNSKVASRKSKTETRLFGLEA